MTVKNLLMTGTFDSTQPGAAQTQAQLFPNAVAQALSALSGVSNLLGQKAGTMRTGGGQAAVQKALIRIAGSGDAQTDRKNGAKVAVVAAGPFIKSKVDQILQSGSGLPSVLLDLEWAAARAVANNPPGLVVPVAPPAPPVTLQFTQVSTFFDRFPGTASYKVTAVNAINAGTPTTQAFNITPVVFSFGLGGDQLAFFLGFYGPDALTTFDTTFGGTFPIAGQLTYQTTDTISPDVYVADTNLNAVTAEITKNGVPAGSAVAGGSPFIVPELAHDAIVAPDFTLHDAVVNAVGGGFAGKQVLEGGSTTPMTAVSGSITFTPTGNVAAGAVVLEAFLFGTQLVEI